MATDRPSTDSAPAAAAASAGDDVDQRSAALDATGIAHHRSVARTMAVLAPVLIVAAILALWLLGR